MPKVIDLPTTSSIDNGDYLIMEESTGGTKKITKANVMGSTLNTISAGGFLALDLAIPINGGSVTVPLRQSSAYSAALIVGAAGGSGALIVGVQNQNGALTTRNLMTNSAWDNPAGLVISAGSDSHSLVLTNNSGNWTLVSVYAG